MTRRDHRLPDPAPLRAPTELILGVGTTFWAVGLLLVLLVPSWHEGSRDGWPWICVAGVILGLVGLRYVRRGRGNAADA